MALLRRAQVLSLQPATAYVAAWAGGCDQGTLGLRAGPSAAQGRTRSGPLRGALLDRVAPARADDVHGLCLPAAPALGRASPDAAGGKGRPVCRDRLQDQVCPPCAAP